MSRTRTPVERQAYTPRELAAALGVNRHTVQNWLRRGYIPSVKIGGSRLIPADVFQRKLAEAEAERRAS